MRTPKEYPATVPFLTTMRSWVKPKSVMAADWGPPSGGHVELMECPCRSMVIPLAATTRQSPQLVRSAVSLYVVFGVLKAWQLSMFTAPSALARSTAASVVTRTTAIPAATRMFHWCMWVPS